MPVICIFRGLKVYMYFSDHLPPHFHVKYGDYEAIVSISDAVIVEGELPKKQEKLILAWAVLRREELMENWDLACSGCELFRIDSIK